MKGQHVYQKGYRNSQFTFRYALWKANVVGVNDSDAGLHLEITGRNDDAGTRPPSNKMNKRKI